MFLASDTSLRMGYEMFSQIYQMTITQHAHIYTNFNFGERFFTKKIINTAPSTYKPLHKTCLRGVCGGGRHEAVLFATTNVCFAKDSVKVRLCTNLHTYWG